MFGKSIEFDVVFNEEATKDYADPPENCKYANAQRIVKVTKIEPLTGIIVGQTWKCDGVYYKGSSGYDSWNAEYYSEPAYLGITKRWPFWIVYTGMNKMHLVPKKEMPSERYFIFQKHVEWDFLTYLMEGYK